MEKIGRGKTACITGSSGFIGGHLVNALLAGGWRVRRLLRKESLSQAINTGCSSDSVEFFPIPEGDSPDLRTVLDGVSVFFNLAGVLLGKTEREFYDGNVNFTKKIVRAVEQCKGPDFRKFLHLSSLAALGPCKDGIPLNENAQPQPIGWYGNSKLDGEKAILEYADKIPVAIMRPCAVYGPGDRAFLSLFKFMRKGPAVYPSGDFRISLIHVGDLVEGIIGAGEASIPSGSIYNLCGDAPIKHSELCMSLAEIYGRCPLKIPLPVVACNFVAFLSELSCFTSNSVHHLNRQKVMEICGGDWTCENSKAKSDFGFNPKWGIKAGLRSTFDWYVREGWI